MGSVGRTLAVGLGIGLVGMQASALLFRGDKKSREASGALYKMLQALREGTKVEEAAARQALAFWGLLSDYPAAAVALELSPLADLCVRLAPYRSFGTEAYGRLVRGAGALALLQIELAYGWRRWSLATPRFLHAATFEMLMGMRKLRQNIARSSADYLPDFDELAAEVSAVHADTSANALLESRSRSESAPPLPRRALPGAAELPVAATTSSK
jgi:hypothetical protein